MELEADFVPSAQGDASGANIDPQTPTDQQPDETQQEQQQGEKPRSGVAKRIDELTANWREEQRRSQYLEALLAQALQQQQPTPQPRQEVQQPAAPQGKPQAEQFQTYEQYVEALADWRFEQRMSEQRAQDEARARQAEEAARVSTFQQRVSQFESEHPDFAAVAFNPRLPVSPAMAEIIQTHESGAALLYALGQNPAEAQRIASLPAHQAAFALAGFWYANNAPSKPTPQPAPKPINPIGTGATSSEPGANGEHISSGDEWARWRNEQLRRK